MAGALALALSGCPGQADAPALGSVQEDAASADGEALVRGQSCDALLGATQAELLAELSRLVEQLRRNYGITSPNAASERLGLAPSGAALDLTTGVLPAEPPSPPPNAGVPSSFSPTTTRVPGEGLGETRRLWTQLHLFATHALFTANRAYIAASSVRATEATDIVVVDLSDPASPQLAGRLQQTYRSIGALGPVRQVELT